MTALKLILCIISMTVLFESCDAQSYLEELQKKADKCYEEHGTTKEELSALKSRDEKQYLEKSGCLFACVLQGNNLMNDGGVLDEKRLCELVKEYIKHSAENSKQLDDLCTKCVAASENTGKDKCNTAFLLLKCYNENKDSFTLANE